MFVLHVNRFEDEAVDYFAAWINLAVTTHGDGSTPGPCIMLLFLLLKNCVTQNLKSETTLRNAC